LIFDLNTDAGTTLILVTHDLNLANRAGRVIHMKNGKLFSDSLTTSVS